MKSYMHDALLKKYIVWTEQIASECKDLCGDMYSNPCYLGIPEDWEGATNRIMIVGEEAAGEWGFGKAFGWGTGSAARWKQNASIYKIIIDPIEVFEDGAVNAEGIEKLMRYNAWAAKDYHLGKGRKSAFWRRFGQIAGLENCAVVWNNIDKICLRKTSKCALSDGQRALLHSVGTKILKEEIDILKPNVVLFCGWHEISLKEELPCIATEYNRRMDEPLEPDILKMCVDSKAHIATKRYLCEIKRDGGIYIMSYHPTWGNFQNGYEGAVFEMVKKALKKQ